MQNMPEHSRLAELTAELLGAQAASNIIAKIWDEASPERKREMSDAVLKAVLKRLDSNTWMIDEAAGGYIREFMRENSEAIHSHLKGQMLDRVKASVDRLIEQTTSYALQDMARAFAKELGSRFQKALEGVR